MTKCSTWLPGHDKAPAARAPVFETVGDGLLGRINPDRYAVDFDDFNSGANRWFGIPEDTERYAVYFRDLSMAGQCNIDRMWNLRGQFMMSEG
jgi:hypothetical protein